MFQHVPTSSRSKFSWQQAFFHTLLGETTSIFSSSAQRPCRDSGVGSLTNSLGFLLLIFGERISQVAKVGWLGVLL